MKKSDKMRKLLESLEKQPKKEKKKIQPDVNGDGKVDEKDLSEVHKAYAKEKKAEEKKEKKIRSKKK